MTQEGIINPVLMVHQEVKKSKGEFVIVGAGLAGSECAWQLLNRGHKVTLIEQRPRQLTQAHKTGQFAELVCSNSLKSLDPYSAPGLLKKELSHLDSLILKMAFEYQVPAGQALAVERDKFSAAITQKIKNHPHVEFIEGEVENFEELMGSGPNGLRPVVIATGPLTGEKLSQSLARLVGEKLYFYDAIAPIVAGESINRSIAFQQNRYDKASAATPTQTDSTDEGDYLNCPLNEKEYEVFISELARGEKVEFQNFEKAIYFQGCQPVESLLERGPKTLAFGPMKPVGIIDPRTGDRPFAVVQLRKEDTEGRAWNMVGFQTKLKYPEQKKIFSLIPGLENAEFYRYGSLHRNTYINSPALLDSQFRLKNHPTLFFAGQITGVEGYLESTAIGALVGRILSLRSKPQTKGDIPLPPPTTALGALAQAIVNGRVKNFQPLNMNWGLVPLNEINERDSEKKTKLVNRAERQFKHWLALF
jgi:methylenetetrahydrofolate--tRNA-(uracil-5-)-methyltransferase